MAAVNCERGPLNLATDLSRLGRNCRLLADHPGAWIIFPEKIGCEYRGLFRIGPRGELVAGGHVHGGDDVCRGHAAGGGRISVHAGRGGELAVVEFSAVRDDDGIFVRATVAAFWIDYRRAVCGDAL